MIATKNLEIKRIEEEYSSDKQKNLERMAKELEAIKASRDKIKATLEDIVTRKKSIYELNPEIRSLQLQGADLKDRKRITLEDAAQVGQALFL